MLLCRRVQARVGVSLRALSGPGRPPSSPRFWGDEDEPPNVVPIPDTKMVKGDDQPKQEAQQKAADKRARAPSAYPFDVSVNAKERDEFFRAKKKYAKRFPEWADVPFTPTAKDKATFTAAFNDVRDTLRYCSALHERTKKRMLEFTAEQLNLDTRDAATSWD